jgi:SAM-dependent methyltransferase
MTQAHEPNPHIKVAVHSAFYHWAKTYAQDKVVLDAGCGEGYGTDILAETAQKVVGVDIDARAIETTQQNYDRDNLEFVTMDCQNMTFAPETFDLVVSNALLEYLSDCDAFFASAYAVLKPGGTFICSTKNLLLSLKKADGTPLYANHLQEFSPASLKSKLEESFVDVKIYGEHGNERATAYTTDRSATKIEALLVWLRIKDIIPLKWRYAVRKRLTGIAIDEIAPTDFVVSENNPDEAWYVIGHCTKK